MRFLHHCNGQMIFTGVKYGSGDSADIVDCASVEDVRRHCSLPGQGGGGTDPPLHQEDFKVLFSQGGMYRLMAEMGVADFKMQGNTRGPIFLSELRMMTVPYARVSSISEAGEKSSVWRAQKVPAFNLRGVKYYAGTNILRALENGDASVLTAPVPPLWTPLWPSTMPCAP